MSYSSIIGTTTRNGQRVENLKIIHTEPVNLKTGEFNQIRTSYPDMTITDTFRVDELYESFKYGNLFYEFYTISEHRQDIDRTPSLLEENTRLEEQLALAEDAINFLIMGGEDLG